MGSTKGEAGAVGWSTKETEDLRPFLDNSGEVKVDVVNEGLNWGSNLAIPFRVTALPSS